VTERKRRLRAPTPSLPRLKTGEIPGIRGETRPYTTLVLVALGLVGCLLWRTGLFNDSYAQLAIVGRPDTQHLWKIATSPFIYDNTGYAFACLATVGLYGWLVERRHGMFAVIVLFVLGGAGGIAVAAAASASVLALGANGAALALLVAWVIPDLMTLRRGQEVDGDLIGTAVVAAVVALMPLVVPEASWVAGGVGILAGALIGWTLVLLAKP